MLKFFQILLCQGHKFWLSHLQDTFQARVVHQLGQTQCVAVGASVCVGGGCAALRPQACNRACRAAVLVATHHLACMRIRRVPILQAMHACASRGARWAITRRPPRVCALFQLARRWARCAFVHCVKRGVRARAPQPGNSRGCVPRRF